MNFPDVSTVYCNLHARLVLPTVQLLKANTYSTNSFTTK